MSSAKNTPFTGPSPALLRVAKGDLCAGCGLCAGLAPGRIKMEMTPPGFPRPVQTADLSGPQEAGITASCPGLGQSSARAGEGRDPLWGPYRQMVTGWAGDENLRFAGASGGALSALAAHLLISERVDGVIQIEADPANPTGNRTRISETAAQVGQAAGSRYAPSSPLVDLATYLTSGRRYAFIGKPCDCAALRALSLRDPAVARAFPVVLSFFCAGVPSAAGAQALLDTMGVPADQLAAFRYRGNGWPGRATATLQDGTTRDLDYHTAWGGVLAHHVQHRCKICADGTGVAADLVCADAWEADAKGYPLFDEAPGVSLIVARTRLGAEILAQAEAGGTVQTQPFDVANLAAIQPGQRERRRALFARLAALRLVARPVPVYVGMDLRACARQNPIARNLRNFAGTIRRAFSRPK
ncbi:Coenzyme F420 hydrogenase/dehydrogenase, beta subunit C-terminal domain [Thioclava sp.]|uniref:Coenzyme F420 hydrogenase/dehydrogenase, beta subunit C-terminal domain n=1 Tax=Thioclava sp. TaxID=1933450 RepID=UPI003AA8D6DC